MAERIQWNVAGWYNTQSTIQTNDAIADKAARHQVETGRWYELKLEVRDRTVRGYVDGQLVNKATRPRDELPPYSLSILRLGARQQ